MNIMFYLSTCNTCKAIIDTLKLPSEVLLQDIKTQPLTSQQLDKMHSISGGYEILFSKRARLFQSLDLKNKNLSEEDYKSYILEHYTFLKRPVLIYNNQIFIGNSKKTVAAAKQAIHEK